MATRNILHRSRLESLKAWLGKEVLPPVGKYEVLRWKNHPGKPMKIVFDNDHSCEHLSVNDAAYHDVMSFIRYDKNIRRNDSGCPCCGGKEIQYEDGPSGAYHHSVDCQRVMP